MIRRILDTPGKRGIVTLLGLILAGIFTTWLLVFVLFPVSKKVVEQKQSPDGKLTAVVEQTQNGNSLKHGYYIFIEQKSFFSNRPQVATIFITSRNPQEKDITIEWVKPDALEIRYAPAENVFAPKTDVQCGADTVHIDIAQSNHR